MYLATETLADMLATIHDETEEQIEDDRKADDGERESAGAEESDELVAGFGEEDAERARERVRAGGGKSDGGGRHGGLLGSIRMMRLRVGGEGEEGVFEGGAGNFERVKILVEGEHLAEGSLGLRYWR